MSLVKSTKNRVPFMGESMMKQDPFFTDLFDSRRGALNLNRLFKNDFMDTLEIPPINVKEQESTLDLELAVPGLKKEDFKITLEEGILTISSEKEESEEEEKNDYIRKEYSYNSFCRTFSLPETIDENKDIKATYNDGVLKIVLNKKENLKAKSPKSVKVS